MLAVFSMAKNAGFARTLRELVNNDHEKCLFAEC